MNIFLTDADPIKCAQALDDLRLNKMILETGQMMCTAYRHYAKLFNWPAEFKDIYKETHVNHPCNIWLRQSVQNYIWGYDLLEALANEKYYRTNKLHTTWIKLNKHLIVGLSNGAPVRISSSLKFDFDCSNVLMQDSTVFQRYHKCLVEKWKVDKREPKWTKREPPLFVTFC